MDKELLIEQIKKLKEEELLEIISEISNHLRTSLIVADTTDDESYKTPRQEISEHKDRKGNVIRVGDRVQAVTPGVNRKYPTGVVVKFNTDTKNRVWCEYEDEYSKTEIVRRYPKNVKKL